MKSQKGMGLYEGLSIIGIVLIVIGAGTSFMAQVEYRKQCESKGDVFLNSSGRMYCISAKQSLPPK